MASPEEMGAYYEGFPDPDDSTTWGGAETFEEAKGNFEAANGPAPAPSPVPGPPSPGAGMPAARLGDLCAHGGVMVGPGCATVLIGYMPAVRAMPAMDSAACPMFDGLIPHVTGTILKGSNSVLIGMFPAARVSDPIGPPSNCKGNQIAKGEPTVLIGDSGAGGGGPSAAAVAEAVAASEAAQEAQEMAEQAASASSALTQAAAAGTPLVQVAPPCQQMRQAAEETKHMVAVRVVHDATGEPVPGVQLKITLPDGKVESRATDGGGQIVIEDIEQPGMCSVACETKGARLSTTLDFVAMGEVRTTPPEPSEPAQPASTQQGARVIAEIEEHKVQTGESIQSLAASCGMTWQELAMFNWDTAAPAEINTRLREQVGCTKKTSSGSNYTFDSSDDPGIVYLPRPWRATGLVTDKEHTVRVRIILPYGLRIRLDLNPNDASRAEDQFVLSSTDGSYRVSKTVKNDLIPGDDYVDLHYSGLKAGKSYTLEAQSPEGGREVLFQNVPYEQLPGLSPSRPPAQEYEVVAGPGEGAPYPDEPDDEGDPGYGGTESPPQYGGGQGDQYQQQGGYTQRGGYQQGQGG